MSFRNEEAPTQGRSTLQASRRWSKTGLKQSILETFEFLLYQCRNSMLRQIDLRHCHVEGFGDLFHGPLLEHVKVKDLKLPGVDLLFDPGEGRIRQVLLPFLVPDRLEVDSGRIGNALKFQREHRFRIAGWSAAVALAFSIVKGNAFSRQIQQIG